LLDLPERYYPQTAKVIIMLAPLKNVLQYDGWVKELGIHTDESHIALVECAPRAVLALEAQKLRYYVARNLVVSSWWSVVPYDVALLAKDRAPSFRAYPGLDQLADCDDPSMSVAPQPGLIVARNESKDYAAEVKKWWMVR